MKSSGRRLNALLTLARTAARPPAPCADLAPHPGFASRIARQWSTQVRAVNTCALWERLCWRGAAVSAVICLGAFLHSNWNLEPTAFDILLNAPMTGSVAP